ncbi:hypothetical protein OROGR_032064 [Orobanche gracilis]
MKPLSIFFVISSRRFLLSLLLLLMIEATTSRSQNHLINSTCRKFIQYDPNINFDFCTTSLQAAPASQCATLQGLGTISIRLIRYNITDTRCHIKQLLLRNNNNNNNNNNMMDPYVERCLDDCLELYSDAIPSVKQAMRNYNAKRFDEANVHIASIMDASTTCEDGFKERKGVVSPLTKRNNDAFQLSALALSTINIVEDGRIDRSG